MKLEDNHTDGKRTTESLKKAMEALKGFANGMLEVTKKFNEGFRKKLNGERINNMSLEDMLKKSIELQSRSKVMKKGKEK
ncbi:hypothetical protein QJR26_07030 [Clostridium baratii]